MLNSVSFTLNRKSQEFTSQSHKPKKKFKRKKKKKKKKIQGAKIQKGKLN